MGRNAREQVVSGARFDGGSGVGLAWRRIAEVTDQDAGGHCAGHPTLMASWTVPARGTSIILSLFGR